MVQSGVYTLEGFIADIRQVFASNKDPRAQAQGVAMHMKGLLAVPGWLEERIGLPPEGGFGRKDLYVDEEYGHPGPGFLVMCSIQGPGAGGPGATPHDHGASWVVYGVYKGAIEQTKFRWAYPEGAWTSPQLEEVGKLVQRDGEVAFFLPGEIHQTRNAVNGRSLVLRVEAQRLERVVRHRYNMEANSAVAVHASA